MLFFGTCYVITIPTEPGIAVNHFMMTHIF